MKRVAEGYVVDAGIAGPAIDHPLLLQRAIGPGTELHAQGSRIRSTGGLRQSHRNMDYADLVSEMVERKHPFKSGIKAQRGIDF